MSDITSGVAFSNTLARLTNVHTPATFRERLESLGEEGPDLLDALIEFNQAVVPLGWASSADAIDAARDLVDKSGLQDSDFETVSLRVPKDTMDRLEEAIDAYVGGTTDSIRSALISTILEGSLNTGLVASLATDEEDDPALDGFPSLE